MTAVDQVQTKLVECDLSEAVECLRRVRFAEYFLIFFGFHLAGEFAVELIQGREGLIIMFVVDGPLFAAAILACLSCGNLKPNIWRLYPFILPFAALGALLTGFSAALGLYLFPFLKIFLFGLQTSN